MNSKIEISLLRSLYMDALAENIHPLRKDCPNPKSIVKLLRGKKSISNKIIFKKHIIKCPFCLDEIKFALRLLHFEEELYLDLSNLSNSKKDEIQAQNFAQRKKSKNRIFSPRIISEWYKLSAVLILFISISTFILYWNWKKPPSSSRGFQERRLVLVNPRFRTIEKRKASFHWDPVTLSNYYILELYDESLRPIWNSNNIFNNQYRLPDEIADKLLSNHQYFWMVRAFLSDGTQIESRLEVFRIK